MDNKILNTECGFCAKECNPFAGNSELAEDLLWFESSVEKANEPKHAKRHNKKFGFNRKNQPSPEEIQEQVEYENEVYEEFSSDFDGLDYTDDEANADFLEAAADMHIECPYSHTSNYTMIADPTDDSSITSTSQS